METLFRLVVIAAYFFKAAFFYVLNLRDDTLPSAGFPLAFLSFFVCSLTSFFSIITAAKLSYKRIKIVL